MIIFFSCCLFSFSIFRSKRNSFLDKGDDRLVWVLSTDSATPARFKLLSAGQSER